MQHHIHNSNQIPYSSELKEIVTWIMENIHFALWNTRSLKIKPYYNAIVEATNFLQKNAKLRERFYCIINDITEHPKCVHCNENSKFSRCSFNYYERCSRKCVRDSKILSIKNKEYWDRLSNEEKQIRLDKLLIQPQNFRNLSIDKKYKLSMYAISKFYEKYGVSNPMYVQEFVDKIASHLPIKDSNYFLERFKLKHGDRFEYVIPDNIEPDKKIEIICPAHGKFEQTPNNHLHSTVACGKCAREITGLKSRTDHSDFINLCEIKHNFKYDYGLVIYEGRGKKIEIICPEHGPFLQWPSDHIGGAGCPACSSSKGELAILKFLESKKIRFKVQKTYPDLKNIKKLRYDFFLLDFNILIEFDGIQHFEPTRRSHKQSEQEILDTFKLIKLNDFKKTQYAIDKNIKLIRIPYYDLENIEKILMKELNIVSILNDFIDNSIC